MWANDGFGNLPGIGTEVDTFVNAYCFGSKYRMEFVPATINQLAIDAGNTPTWELRQGLILGQITTTQQWTAYSKTATDGSEVASGVLMTGLRMQDIQGGTRPAFYGIMVAGGLIAANLIGLDYQARQQMHGRFLFDDDLAGNRVFPFKAERATLVDLALTAALNGYLITNTGAVGAVVLTLPAVTSGPGLSFGMAVDADQSMTIASAEGDNIIAPNDASADSLAFSTGGDKVGGLLRVFGNAAGTKWRWERLSPNAVSIAT